MGESKNNKSGDFDSKEEAFEFLIQQSQNESLKEEWKKNLDSLPDVEYTPNTKSKSVFLTRIIAVAASLLLIISSYFLFSNQQTDSLQMVDALIHQTNFVLENDLQTRDLEDVTSIENGSELQRQILAAMEIKDYEKAANLFSNFDEKELSTSYQFAYALSLSRQEDGDFDKAKNLLQYVVSKESMYHQEALWLQALLYLKTGERNKSKIVLNKLISQSNYQLNNAKTLLEGIAD